MNRRGDLSPLRVPDPVRFLPSLPTHLIFVAIWRSCKCLRTLPYGSCGTSRQAAKAIHAPIELAGWRFSTLTGDRPSGKRHVGPKVAFADKTSPSTTSSHHRLGPGRGWYDPAADSCSIDAHMNGRGDPERCCAYHWRKVGFGDCT